MQKLNKAVFLDRDGVLVKEEGHYNYLPEHVNINAGIIDALKVFQEKNYLLIVITNQGGIAKGLYKHKDVKQFHQTLRDFFTSYGIKISDFFYCPHHEKTGKCLCRKPGSLMLEKAIAIHKVDPPLSYFIGDTERDVIAGEKAGLTPILIDPNANLSAYLHLIS